VTSIRTQREERDGPIIAAFFFWLTFWFVAGCSPVYERTRFVNSPPPGHCIAHYVRTGWIMRPGQLFVTCADRDGRFVHLQPGGNQLDLLAQLAGPLGSVANRVIIPMPTQ
jgi:hypothetical protein